MTQTIDPVGKGKTDAALTNMQSAAETLFKGNSDALTSGGHAAAAAFQDLAKAYQDLAARNVANLTAAIKELSAVKHPGDFLAIQQRLLTEGVQAAVTDSQNIAKLTAAVFSAAFEPVKHQVEALQKTVHNH